MLAGQGRPRPARSPPRPSTAPSRSSASRVNAFGVAEPEIQTQGNDQIVVALPGADNPEQVVNDLIQPGAARLHQLRAQRRRPEPVGSTPLRTRSSSRRSTKPESSHGLPTYYAFDKQTKQPIPGIPPADTEADLKESFPNNTIPPNVTVQVGPEGPVPRGPGGPAPPDARRGHRRRTYLVFQNNPGLTGADITEARSTIQTGGLGGTRADRHAELHRRRAGRSSRTSRASSRRTARCRTSCSTSRSSWTARSSRARRSTSTTTPTASTGGTAPRSTATSRRARRETLAKQINSGALPINLEVISQKQVSATLGKESLREGLIAGIVGLALVMLFLIVYYRFLGLIAAGALLVYGVLLYAVVVLVPDHADPAGHRGHHPHDRRGVRRQRRHLRTRARGGAGRQDAARRRSSPATRRASRRSSTPTS